MDLRSPFAVILGWCFKKLRLQPDSPESDLQVGQAYARSGGVPRKPRLLWENQIFNRRELWVSNS